MNTAQPFVRLNHDIFWHIEWWHDELLARSLNQELASRGGLLREILCALRKDNHDTHHQRR
jgi:hypothetical protein